MPDDFSKPSCVGYHNRSPSCHRLQRDYAERFIETGEHCYVSCSIKGIPFPVTDTACERNISANTQLFCFFPQDTCVITVACYDESCICGFFQDLWNRRKEHMDAFFVNKPADIEY